MRRVLLFVLTAWLCGNAMAAAQGDAEHLQGTVTTVTATTITIRTTDNQTRTIAVGAATMIMRGSAHVTIAGVAVGDAVLVDVDRKTSIATSLELGAGGPAPAQHQHLATAGNAAMDSREASGTSWQPASSPMYAFHRAAGAWDLMLHGQLFVQYFQEIGPEHHAGRQAGSINWLMGDVSRALGQGRFGLRAMVSAEPWTIPGCGYPDRLATGELCGTDGIHDRQHPHDLFMELSARYDRPLTSSLRWQVYAGLAGEPALGPSSFPHRLSAFQNPVAPIAHHWLDSTHITFGVVTAGLYSKRLKGEVSAFNGREPDESRAGLDLAPLDSIAGRFSVTPGDRMAFQVSAGRLRDAEAGVGHLPRSDVSRFTASASYHRPLSDDGLWATTIAYGANSEVNVVPGYVLDETTHAVLVESSVAIGSNHVVFGRGEIAGKAADDLHAHEFITEIFSVGKLQFGYVRNLRPWHGLVPGVGGTVSLSVVPELLAPRYGGRVAPGFGVFMTVRPGRHSPQ